ncbi:hypothetical protein Tco_1032486 [Tanacetum coccineum]|uniref:Ubinuclein middle domain-containing protein n=1 Tax=Tanacetum coccineum TaxID=301880 RepID=A0ABQ5GDF9_9ASTR
MKPSRKTKVKKHKLVKETFDAPSPAKRSKAGKVTKQRKPKSPLQLVDEFVDEGVPEQEPVYVDEEADIQRALELSIKEQAECTHGPARPVVIRRTSTPTESSGHDESSSLYAELGLTNSETDSDEEVLGIVARVQDEGQAGPNPGDAEASQPPSSHVVHAGPNLEHMDLEASDTSIQPNPEQMDEEFTTMAYPNVQENLKLPTEGEVRLEEPASSAGTLSSLQNLDKELSFADQFLVEKSQEDEPKKTNTESEHIGKFEQHMADMVEANQALEEILGKQGNRLYNLENLDIPHKVSKVVDEIITDAVDWAIQAPLRDRFRDLPKANIKEILHHRMWESNSYQAHENHKMLYGALEKSMARDHTDQLLTNLAEARRKKKKRHASPKTPPGSPPHHPPPLPPPVGSSGTTGASGASGSSQLPLPPSPPSTNQSDQSISTVALSSSNPSEYTA